MTEVMKSLETAWRDGREAGLSDDTQTLRAFQLGGQAVLGVLTREMGAVPNMEKPPLERLLMLSNVMIQTNTDLGKLPRHLIQHFREIS